MQQQTGRQARRGRRGEGEDKRRKNRPPHSVSPTHARTDLSGNGPRYQCGVEGGGGACHEHSTDPQTNLGRAPPKIISLSRCSVQYFAADVNGRHKAQGIACFNESGDNERRICISKHLLRNKSSLPRGAQPEGRGERGRGSRERGEGLGMS